MLPVFLTANWRNLAMINYQVDAGILARFVPAGTELDEFHGKVFVSMVGFMFLQTRIFGVPIPWHVNFEEVNLRFYVRRRVEGESVWRRGAVFIREVVPRAAIAFVARVRYNEPYLALPMRHRIEASEHFTGAEYLWRYGNRWNTLGVTCECGEPQPVVAGSEEEFITEHYWGYNRQRDGGTMEYAVEHPRWRIRRAKSHRFDCDTAAFYGPEFAPVPRSSAFIGISRGRVAGHRAARRTNSRALTRR